MKIAMIGGGYVGLVSGACFAEFGVEVAVVETEPGRLAALRAGQMPIYEPGLADLVTQNRIELYLNITNIQLDNLLTTEASI